MCTVSTVIREANILRMSIKVMNVNLSFWNISLAFVKIFFEFCQWYCGFRSKMLLCTTYCFCFIHDDASYGIETKSTIRQYLWYFTVCMQIFHLVFVNNPKPYKDEEKHNKQCDPFSNISNICFSNFLQMAHFIYVHNIDSIAYTN